MSKTKQVSNKNIFFKNILKKFEKIYDYYFFKSKNIIIEPTNKCNLACSVCYKSLASINSNASGLMEYELFEDILKKAQTTIKSVFLYFRGEFLLHPDIIRFIELCKSYKYGVCVATNGLLLNEEIIKKIILAGLDKIIINYDAISNNDYEIIRGIKKSDIVLNNIVKFNKIKRSLNSPYPNITIKSLNLGHKPGLIHGYVKRLDELGLKGEVCISDYFPWPDMKLLSKFKVRLFPRPRVCPMYYQGLTITYNGNVLPCSYDYMEKYSLGNIRNYNSILNIYKSKGYKDFRRLLLFKKYQTATPCKECLIPIMAIYENYHIIGKAQ